MRARRAWERNTGAVGRENGTGGGKRGSDNERDYVGKALYTVCVSEREVGRRDGEKRS